MDKYLMDKFLQMAMMAIYAPVTVGPTKKLMSFTLTVQLKTVKMSIFPPPTNLVNPMRFTNILPSQIHTIILIIDKICKSFPC